MKLLSYFLMLVAYSFVYGYDEDYNKTKCIKVNKINVEENKLFSQKSQTILLQKYLNKCIDENTLGSIVTTISQYYIDNGYITTKAYLKEQNIEDGILEVDVLVGTLQKIVDSNTSQTNAKIFTAFLFQKNEPLNLRYLETSLEMMNRVPSTQAKFKIQPGLKHGQSIVEIIDEETNPYHLTLSAVGEENINDERPYLSVYFSLDNPMGINDILTFQYNNSDIRETYQSSSGQDLNYSFPLGSYLFETNVFSFDYTQRVIGLNDTYEARGSSEGIKFKINKILFRNQANKLKLVFAVEHKDTSNYFAGELLEVSSYRTSLFQVDLTHTLLKTWGQFVTSYSFYHGSDILGARSDNYFDATTDEKLQFLKHTLTTSLYYNFGDTPYQLNSTLHLQYTDDKLYNNNKLAVGSYYTVRGFSDSYYGNNGGYINNTLERTIHVNYSPLYLQTISPFVGLDYGKTLCDNTEQLACGELLGAAVGFKTDGKHISSDFTWSRSLHSSANLDTEYTFRYSIVMKF